MLYIDINPPTCYIIYSCHYMYFNIVHAKLVYWCYMYFCIDLPGGTRWRSWLRHCASGFGGLVVCMLASGTQDRGFAPGRSRRIFRAKTSVCSFPHVAGLRHVKEHYNLPWKSPIIG
jgi:hypothetical protein